MPTLPSSTLILHDSTGARFGVIRFVVTHEEKLKGDCIFDVDLGDAEQSERAEVRWIYKRRYVRASEHKFKMNDAGVLSVRGGAFALILEPNEEGGFTTVSTSPRLTAVWAPEQ